MTFGPPPYDPYTPPPPPPPPSRWPTVVSIILGVVASSAVIGGTVLLVTGVRDQPPATPVSSTSAPPIAVIPDDAETTDADTGTAMTELVTDLAWDEMAETEKEDMCVSIEIFGTGWAADAMRESQSDEPDEPGWEIDWDLAADRIADKCAERGF